MFKNHTTKKKKCTPCLKILEILPAEVICRIIKFLYKVSHWTRLERTNRALRDLVVKECWNKRVKEIKTVLSVSWCNPQDASELPSVTIQLKGDLSSTKNCFQQLHSYQSFLEFWSKCKNISVIKIWIETPTGILAAAGPHPKELVPDPESHRRQSFCDLTNGINAPCFNFLQYINKCQKIKPVRLQHFCVKANIEATEIAMWQPLTIIFLNKSLNSLTSLHLDDCGANWKIYVDMIQEMPHLLNLRIHISPYQRPYGLRIRPIVKVDEVLGRIGQAISDKRLKELQITGIPWKNEGTIVFVQDFISKIKAHKSFIFDMAAPILFLRAIEKISSLHIDSPELNSPPPFFNEVTILTLGTQNGWMKVVPHLFFTMTKLERVMGININYTTLQALEFFPYSSFTEYREIYIITLPLKDNLNHFHYQTFIQRIKNAIRIIWVPPHHDFTASLVEHSATSLTIVISHINCCLRYHIPETKQAGTHFIGTPL